MFGGGRELLRSVERRVDSESWMVKRGEGVAAVSDYLASQVLRKGTTDTGEAGDA